MEQHTEQQAIDELGYFITSKGLSRRVSNIEQILQETSDTIFDPLAQTHVLQVNVFDSKTRFVENPALTFILQNIERLQELRIAIQVNYASGLKVLFHATSVKPNFISLHAKSGSCELHLAADGSFTIAGTR